MLYGSVSCDTKNKWPFVLQGKRCHDNFSSLFFYSVYILLSSMSIVALDDLHGEFSMDL